MIAARVIYSSADLSSGLTTSSILPFSHGLTMDTSDQGDLHSLSVENPRESFCSWSCQSYFLLTSGQLT